MSSRICSCIVALFLLASNARANWYLVWSDEFNGSSIDPNHWTFDIGTGPPYPGWGNDELEFYTSRPENAYVSGGALHIVARQESFSGASYTSARLKTQGLFGKVYGRFEFRASLPGGQGLWPALWLFPVDSVYGPWAASGEIDVMENIGGEIGSIKGTFHYGGVFPNNVVTGQSDEFPVGQTVTDFHVYALEWSTNSLKWFVDGQNFETQTSWWSSGGPYPAPFDRPFYIIMSLAVGGYFVGPPPASTVFPQEMQVDYVRIYDTAPNSSSQLSFQRVGANLILAWSSGILQSAPILAGPWVDMPEANSPYTVSPLAPSQFYRVRLP